MIDTKMYIEKMSNFLRNSFGNVSLLFALLLIPVVFSIALAVDYRRGANMRAKLQDATDLAVIAAVRAKMKNPSLNNEKLTSIAQDFLNAHTSQIPQFRIVGFKLTQDTKSGEITASTDATVETNFMRIAGINNLDISVASSAMAAPPPPLELVLVLDNTGSMAGLKLDTLKNAAKKLVDELLDTSEKKSKTKIALVPFSNYVNIGLANRNANWLSVPNDYTDTSHSCWNTYPNQTKSNCRNETRTGYNDGVPYTYETEVCDIDYGDPVEVCGNGNTTYKWNGCVGSRNYPLNVGDSDYTLNKVPGLLNQWCARPILPLTNDTSILHAEIEGMTASQNTYIPAGLAWGWRVLSAANPFNEGRTKAKLKEVNGIKAMVLMTDGTNTLSPSYPEHWNSDTALANSLTADLCANIKDQSITVYTIAFEVSDATVKDLLQSCATNYGYYYDAQNSSELSKAFETITGQLSQLRLTK